MASQKQLRIGILGLGNVGYAVYKLLEENARLLERQAGARFEIKKIAVKNTTKHKKQVRSALLTTDFRSVVSDPEIDIILELIGDKPVALEAMKLALSHGKSVVTANKAIVARHGLELFKLAEKNRCEILFEASVGGGIPILGALREGLAANKIQKLRAIINGTTNFILSEMEEQNTSFKTALTKAQKLGFAESDPTSDVSGLDSQYKLAILILYCYGCEVKPDEIYCQGISQITPLDLAMAKQFDYAIKLLAITRVQGNQIEARVHPAMVSLKNPLSHVRGAFNAIEYQGNYCKEGMLYGRGAGGEPTASAVVSDLLDLARSYKSGNHSQLSPIGFQLSELKRVNLKPIDDLECGYYLRITAQDKPSVLAQISSLLAAQGISIFSVYQHGNDTKGIVTIVIFTHRAKESSVQAAIAQIDQLKVIAQKTQIIRIESDGVNS